MKESIGTQVRFKVVGIGGAGGNAVFRIANKKPQGLELLTHRLDAFHLREPGAIAERL